MNDLHRQIEIAGLERLLREVGVDPFLTEQIRERLEMYTEEEQADMPSPPLTHKGCEAELTRLRTALIAMEHELQQVLGTVLGYPRYCDDQAVFPGSTEADGVCVFANVAVTLADEAAAEIARLRMMNEGLIGRVAACAEVLCAIAGRREQYTPGELRAVAEKAQEGLATTS